MRKLLLALLFCICAPTVYAQVQRLVSTNFSGLGAPPNGYVRYCLNCAKVNPCTAGGTGAVAMRIAGAWDCSAGGGTGGAVGDGDKGDVTVSGTGATWTIDNNTIALAKMADMATASLVGRSTAATGDPEILSVATVKTMLSLNNVDNTSDVTKNAATVSLTNKTIDGDLNTVLDLPASTVFKAGTIIPPANILTVVNSRCVRINGSGVLEAHSGDCGSGGGSPGGSDTQLQRNNSSAFGGISGATSDGTNVTFGSTNLRATRPRFITSIDDTNGNEVIDIGATASAVNQFKLSNSAAGNPIILEATGGDTDISITLAPKGAGTVNIGDPSATTSYLDLLASADPSTPASGLATVYVDTNKTLKILDDAGAASTTVRADAGAANNFLTAISADGVISKAQPAFTNISGVATTAQVVTGTATASRCLRLDASSNIVVHSGDCGSGGGGITNSASNTQVMISDGTNATGDAGLTYDTTTNILTVAGGIETAGSATGIIGLKDTDFSHYLNITPGSNLTALRTLTLITGDADRSITLTGNASLSGTNTGDQTITLTGDVTGTGTGSFAATIADNSIDGTDIALGSDARGDVMYYDGTNWVRLAPGVSGEFLKTMGAGVDPEWDSPAGSGTVSAATAGYVAYYTGTTTVGGEAAFAYNATTDTLTVTNLSVGDGTVTGEAKLFELAANGNDYFSWLGQDSRATILRGRIPSADPTAGQMMVFGAPSSTISTVTWANPALIDAANAWADGIKQTFNPSSTTAGINAGSVAGDPSSPANGDFWYDSTANEFTARINGANVALGAGGAGTPGGSDTQVQFNDGSAFGGDADFVWNKTTNVLTVGGAATGVLGMLDTNATHYLSLTPGSNLTADRTLTFTTGDADRTLTLTGDASLSGTNTGDQTNITGNAATVTTNANLTGPITSSGNATTITNNSVTGAMIALTSQAQGDVMYYDGTDWVRLAPGTDGQFLKTQGAAANPIWATIGGGGDALVANPLSQFAATTSTQLRGVLSDELGTGAALFDGATPTGLVLTNATGTAAGLTAGSVTTNANLTGHVISTGNAVVLGSFTLAQLNTAVSDANMASLTGTEILTNKTLGAGLEINDTSSDHQYVFTVSELTADRNVTIPLLTGDDTFTLNAHAATLVNKTLSLGSNTVSGTAAQFNTALSSDDFATVGVSNAWADGVKQTFNPDGTNAGFNVGSQAGDPSSLADGDVWYNSTTASVRSRVNGVTGTYVRTIDEERSTTDTLTASTISTTETNFAANFVIPANYLKVGKVFRLSIGQQMTTSGTPPTIIIKLKAGSVTLATKAATTPTGGQTNIGGGGTYLITCTATGASGTLETQPVGFTGNMLSPGTPNSQAQPATVDTTGAITLQWSLQYSANTAGNSITLRQWVLEELN